MTNEINDERIAQVRVAISSDFSLHRVEDAWSYIGMARRHRGQGEKCLRYYKDPVECGAVKHSMVVDGWTRTWYEYVPEGCTPDKRWPLVVVMHGRGGSAETFFDLSGMSVVARERKFIAVFPEAGVYLQKPTGPRNVLLWGGEYRGEATDDVKFIRQLVADVESRQSIDHGRIYACGQSSGGMMTDLLGYAAGDLFAACAPWSALRSPERMYMSYEPSRHPAPALFLYGDSDFLCAGRGEDPELPFCLKSDMRAILLEKLAAYGADPARIETWETEPITWYSFSNHRGIPMMVVGKVSDMVHANYPEESWISYDQFLSQFHKDENGVLYYRGRRVYED